MPSAKPKYIPHDRLFKEFFERFLERFTYLFLPEKAAQLNFDDINFFKQELVVNFPGQALRITDVVAEVALKELKNEIFSTSDNSHKLKKSKDKKVSEGDDTVEDDTVEDEEKRELIIIHIDAEANRPQTIPSRMFVYYGLLRIIKGMPVLPIAFIIRKGASQPAEKGEDAITIETYTETLWGEQHVSFRYYQVDLGRLRSEDYLKNSEPVAACLAALMHHPEKESAVIKKRIFDIIVQSDLDNGDKVFLAEVVGTYLPNEQVQQSATEEVMQQLIEYEKTWIEVAREEGLATGIAKGREEGREEGTILGQQRILFKLLDNKFGEIPDELRGQIEAIKDADVLEGIATQVLFLESLDKLSLPDVV
ncbi:MAG: hypothetical protein AAF639_02705 [Chloroflexota bacterium]